MPQRLGDTASETFDVAQTQVKSLSCEGMDGVCCIPYKDGAVTSTLAQVRFCMVVSEGETSDRTGLNRTDERRDGICIVRRNAT